MASGSRTRARRWALLAVMAVAAGNLFLLAVPSLRQARWVPVAMLLASAMMVVAIYLLARPLSRTRSRRRGNKRIDR